MLNQFQVGALSNTSLGDGSVNNAVAGKQGDLLVSEAHGKYYTQNYRNNLFYASNAAAGAAFTIFSNASFVGLALINPPGSGKNLSIVKASVGLATLASTAAGSFGYCWVNNVNPSGVGTAAVISAITLITATRGPCVCGPSGGTQGSSVAIALSACTLSAAMTWGRGSGMCVGTGAITTMIGYDWHEDLDGTLIVPQGTMLALTTNILTGITGVGTLVWEEVPV